jgi:hypothetical protein
MGTVKSTHGLPVQIPNCTYSLFLYTLGTVLMNIVTYTTTEFILVYARIDFLHLMVKTCTGWHWPTCMGHFLIYLLNFNCLSFYNTATRTKAATISLSPRFHEPIEPHITCHCGPVLCCQALTCYLAFHRITIIDLLLYKNYCIFYAGSFFICST